jgi:hypothetical protein
MLRPQNGISWACWDDPGMVISAQGSAGEGRGVGDLLRDWMVVVVGLEGKRGMHYAPLTALTLLIAFL